MYAIGLGGSSPKLDGGKLNVADNSNIHRLDSNILGETFNSSNDDNDDDDEEEEKEEEEKKNEETEEGKKFTAANNIIPIPIMANGNIYKEFDSTITRIMSFIHCDT